DRLGRRATAAGYAFAVGSTPHPHLARAVREEAELKVQRPLARAQQLAHRLCGADDARERGDERDRRSEVRAGLLLVQIEAGRTAAHALATPTRLFERGALLERRGRDVVGGDLALEVGH